MCNTVFDESTAVKVVKKSEKAVEIEDEIVVDTGISIQKVAHKNIKKLQITPVDLMGILLAIFIIVPFVILTFIAIWVYKDAKKRKLILSLGF